MKHLSNSGQSHSEEMFLIPPTPIPLALPVALDYKTSELLQRMFRDPRVLEQHERTDLIAQLRQSLALVPEIAEVRVLLGMALCVNLQPQEAMEELREAVNLSPDCFIARLKFGELLMRLRVCDQAAEQTQKAAQLATNNVQSELARRQAATIRAMLREGVERGGYGGMLSKVLRFRRKSTQPSNVPELVGSK
jgi:tetratricopeptide (TPR) repeat protein